MKYIACAITTLLFVAALAQTLDPVTGLIGYVVPARETDVKPEKAGRIKKVHFNRGDRVKAGDLLLEIDEEDTLSAREVRAPNSGTILRSPVVEGQFVRSASADDVGTVLTTIADHSKVVVEAHVKQADAAKLSLHQPVQITADEAPDARMEGVITFIARVATVKNSVKGVTVQATVETADP